MNAPRRTTFEVLSVRVPYPVFEAVREVAEIRGVTVSKLMRDMIRLYFETSRNVAVERGLVDEFGNRNNNNRKGSSS
jgi:hypothetical protein